MSVSSFLQMTEYERRSLCIFRGFGDVEDLLSELELEFSLMLDAPPMLVEERRGRMR
jgi:hypothetical protein